MSDPRFARLKSDPRFRRPKKKASTVVVDERFKSVFDTKKKRGRVDKYGRPLSNSRDQEDLRRFYGLKGPTEDGAPGDDGVLDFARGQVLLESSDEDQETDDEEPIPSTSNPSQTKEDAEHRAEDVEVDLDEDQIATLDAQAAAYANSHPEVQIEDGQRSRRLAAVNLDWDHVRASHLFKIFSSLLSTIARPVSRNSLSESQKHSRKGNSIPHGAVLSVRVYPSEFGKERLAQEERDGPPAHIYKKRLLDEEEINEKSIYDVGGEDDYDEDALRTYQLERLRYYYAVITCDTVEAASHIYDELEGTELERSANIFDLSFVPDDMAFEGEFRDEATSDSGVGGTQGIDFVTDALRHSKVRLTWDDDDAERNQITRRPLSKKQIEEGDFAAYLASSDSDSAEGTQDNQPKSRDRLRNLLLGTKNDLPEGWGDEGDDDDIDMEVTFTPALTKQHDGDETTLEKYQRKIREKRRNKGKSVASDPQPHESKDEFFEDSEEETADLPRATVRRLANPRQENAAPEIISTVEESSQHFNLKSILKAEKKSSRKKTRSRGKRDTATEDAEIQPDFSVNLQDQRFKRLHEDHNFAIDPSNPHFKKTKGMTAFLNERSKHRSVEVDQTRPSNHEHQGSQPNLERLVENVKRKSTIPDRSRAKRRKGGAES